jgi:hypothetical protein
MGTDKLVKQAYSHDPRFADDIETFQIGFENAVLMALQHLPPMIDAISDLYAHLIVSPTKAFITSDNPAFKYNLYCEKIQHMGITGALNRGLQIFLPLAPHLQLMLYDAAIYKVPAARFSVATQSDVDNMNAMQLFSAGENIYFSDWQQLNNVRKLAAKLRHHRKVDRITVLEYGQDDDPTCSLLHEFERTPYLKIELSFLRVNRSARRISLEDRGRVYRKEIPMPPVPEPPNLKGRTVTFSRFIGKR